MLRQPKNSALRVFLKPASTLTNKSAPNASYSELQKATEAVLQSKGTFQFHVPIANDPKKLFQTGY
jgi:hypothetical protein